MCHGRCTVCRQGWAQSTACQAPSEQQQQYLLYLLLLCWSCWLLLLHAAPWLGG